MTRIMKLSALALIALFMTACNQQQLQEEVDYLTQENERLRQETVEKESSLNDFFESLVQIRENLTEIKVRQNLISEETRDRDNIDQDVRQQIDSDLAMINELMEDNRRRLAGLNRQLRDSNLKIEEFETMVASLTDDVEEKTVEVSILRDNIHELNVSNEVLVATVDKLEEENKEKLNVIEHQTEQLNTAYYVFGTRNELQEQNIIDRQGGLLGIGRTTVVNTNIDRTYLTRIDIRSVEKVEVPGSNLRLISNHPNESYVVESSDEDNTQIIIEDPEKFWSNTRYLIVSID